VTTALDIDLSLLVGELDAPACEHPRHNDGTRYHSDEPASHYIRAHCDHCGLQSDARAMCPRYMQVIFNNEPMYCTNCHKEGTAAQFIQVLGPVNT